MIATPEVHYNKMGDEHLLRKKPQTAELHVRPEKVKDGLVYHDEAVQTDLTAEQITRMEQASFKQRDELKEICLWRMYNEMIAQSGFTLVYLHSMSAHVI